MKNAASRIDDLVSAGWNTKARADYNNWQNRVFAFLSSAVDETTAERFKTLGKEALYESWSDCRDRQVGHLEGLAVRLADEGSHKGSTETQPATPTPPVH